MKGAFITFEGTEGSGKTTQVRRLADRLAALGHAVRLLREPGGTPIGEEIRHTLQHSRHNTAMTPETELLLLNASRAQLVREIIRPALDTRAIVLCDRFHDSTVAYQGYGRGLDLDHVRRVIDLAVGDTLPHLTLLLRIPVSLSEARRQSRTHDTAHAVRDRMEEARRDFFERVERGFDAIAAADPRRIRVIDGSQPIAQVEEAVWHWVEPLLTPMTARS